MSPCQSSLWPGEEVGVGDVPGPSSWAACLLLLCSLPSPSDPHHRVTRISALGTYGQKWWHMNYRAGLPLVHFVVLMSSWKILSYYHILPYLEILSCPAIWRDWMVSLFLGNSLTTCQKKSCFKQLHAGINPFSKKSMEASEVFLLRGRNCRFEPFELWRQEMNLDDTSWELLKVIWWLWLLLQQFDDFLDCFYYKAQKIRKQNTKK